MSSRQTSTRSSSSSSSSSALRAQLSRRLSAAVAGASTQSLDPTLRAALVQPGRQQSAASALPFAARAALDPDDLQASLAMFRRLSSGRRSDRSGEAGKLERVGRGPGGGSDSARATDEGGTPRSQTSLLELLDEGWCGLHPQEPSAAAVPPPPLPSPFAPHTSGGSPPSSAGQPSIGSCYSTAASDTAVFCSLRGVPDEDGGAAAAGCDTPRSGVSWASCMSTAAGALPQTEAELLGLDLGEVELLAAEAAELQARAALALRLARARMGGSGAAPSACFAIPEERKEPRLAVGAGSPQRGEGAASQQAVAAEARHGRCKGGGSSARSGALPADAGVALQLYLLLLVVLEGALLAVARLAQRASLGALRPPRELVLAPVAVARCALCLALLAADMLHSALGALRVV